MTSKSKHRGLIHLCKSKSLPLAIICIAIAQPAQLSWSYECSDADIIVVKKSDRISSSSANSSMAVRPLSYGWEFFGLTKEELGKHVARMNLDLGNHMFWLYQDGTNLSSNLSSRGGGWHFEYRDGRIDKVKRLSPGAGQIQHGVMQSRSHALSLAISDYTHLLAAAQESADYYSRRTDYSKQHLPIYLAELHKWYTQRAIVYEQDGQRASSQADYHAAAQLNLEIEKNMQGSYW